jgi:predicted TIM-barrel fold metal-dependent hydrolase
MGDVDHAVREFEWAVDRDAHVVVIRPAPATTSTGRKSPFNSYFDPFWARVNEAGITVAVHGADSGWSSQGYVQNESFGSRSEGPSIRAWAIERSAYDFLAQAIFEKLFVRFPNLRLAMIENGSAFVGDLLRHIESQRKKSPWWFTDHDPVETFKQHVWVNPFWEDDPYEVIDVMGIDRVLFGSDWPHIEGLPEPLDFVHEITKLPPEDQKKVLRDNIEFLNTPQPV